MSKTLTIRLPDAQDLALARRARALGRTRSALVRELIAQGLDEPAIGPGAKALKGSLDLSGAMSGWRKRIKERNWR